MEIQYKSWLSLPNFIVTILYVIVVAHFQAADQFPSTPRWENMAIMAHNTRWLLFEILVLFTHQIIKRTPNMVLNCSCGFLFAIYNWSQMSTKLNRPEKSKHFNERKSFIKENCSYKIQKKSMSQFLIDWNKTVSVLFFSAFLDQMLQIVYIQYGNWSSWKAIKCTFLKLKEIGSLFSNNGKFGWTKEFVQLLFVEKSTTKWWPLFC